MTNEYTLNTGLLRTDTELFSPKHQLAVVLNFRDMPDAIRAHGARAAAGIAAGCRTVDLPGIGANPAPYELHVQNTLTPGEYTAETERLAELIRTIVSGEVDLFDYLPYTKAGLIPRDRNIVVAEAGFDLLVKGDGFVRIDRLQLRLVPTYVSDTDFIVDRKDWTHLALVFGAWPKTDLTPPVFDAQNRPALPVTKKSGNLPDADIKPGRVYKDGKTEFLYLGRLMIAHSHFVDGEDIIQHIYVKHTKDVATALALADPAPDSVVRIYLTLLRSLDGKTFQRLVSSRDTPRRFQSLVNTYLDTDDETKLSGVIPNGSGAWWETLDGGRTAAFMLRPPEGRKFAGGRVWLVSTQLA